MLVRTEHGWGEASTFIRCLPVVSKCHVIFDDKVAFYGITYGNPIIKVHGLLLFFVQYETNGCSIFRYPRTSTMGPKN